jgi:hypothetical protein
MAEQQNSGTGNTGNFGSQSTTGGSSSGGGSSTSAQAAKDNTSLTTGGESGNTESTGTLGNVTNKVKGIYQTAAESQVGQAAKDALGQVKENATSTIDDKKANIAQGLTSVAETLRQVGDSVKPPEGEPANKVAELTTQYTETLSQQVEKVSGYLEQQDLRGLMNDLESFARRNPAIFLGGAFALGILAARFLKSSNPNQALMRTSDLDSGREIGNLTSTPSSLGGASTGSSGLGETSGSSSTGIGGTGIGSTTDSSSLGDKGDSFGETSGSFGSGGADSVRQFNTGSGAAGSTGTTGTSGTTSTTGSATTTGTTGGTQDDTSSTSPTPSNKTAGDFGSSKF